MTVWQTADSRWRASLHFLGPPWPGRLQLATLKDAFWNPAYVHRMGTKIILRRAHYKTTSSMPNQMEVACPAITPFGSHNLLKSSTAKKLRKTPEIAAEKCPKIVWTKEPRLSATWKTGFKESPMNDEFSRVLGGKKRTKTSLSLGAIHRLEFAQRSANGLPLNFSPNSSLSRSNSIET